MSPDDAAAPDTKPHPVATLIPGFDVLQSAWPHIFQFPLSLKRCKTLFQNQGGETWARNWATLLDTKTQEGAYAFLKTLVKTKITADEDEAGDEPAVSEMEEVMGAADKVEGEPVELVDRLSLWSLSLCGMNLVESSLDYNALFDQKGCLTSLDLKLLETKLELFLWDCCMSYVICCVWGGCRFMERVMMYVTLCAIYCSISL